MAIFANNNKIHFNYDIEETFDAGIELMGHEVKAIRNNKVSLEGAYIIIRGGEAFVVNMLVSPYQENNISSDYEPRRNRKIILTKDEIAKLANVDGQRNLTIVPISIYDNGHLLKLKIAIVKGKKKHDKRETTKKRESDREMGRMMKDR